MRKTNIDVNNVHDKKRKKDHMYSDILGAEGNVESRSGLKQADDLVLTTNNWQTTDIK